MTKTLAEMTPEKRANCGGMWAETTNGLAIIIEPFFTEGALDTAVVFSLKPKVEILQCIAVYVTPRFDLPRAWPPDGVPVAGEYEYAVQYKTPGGWAYSREPWDCRWQDNEAVQEVRAYRDHPEEETRIVRRLVSQPEVMEP